MHLNFVNMRSLLKVVIDTGYLGFQKNSIERLQKRCYMYRILSRVCILNSMICIESNGLY